MYKAALIYILLFTRLNDSYLNVRYITYIIEYYRVLDYSCVNGIIIYLHIYHLTVRIVIIFFVSIFFAA